MNSPRRDFGHEPLRSKPTSRLRLSLWRGSGRDRRILRHLQQLTLHNGNLWRQSWQALSPALKHSLSFSRADDFSHTISSHPHTLQGHAPPFPLCLLSSLPATSSRLSPCPTPNTRAFALRVKSYIPPSLSLTPPCLSLSPSLCRCLSFPPPFPPRCLRRVCSCRWPLEMRGTPPSQDS